MCSDLGDVIKIYHSCSLVFSLLYELHVFIYTVDVDKLNKVVETHCSLFLELHWIDIN